MRLVSVIIPMFNAERTIERTLESVRRQSHSNLEVLVVDDGSTDGSASIVDAFCTIDDRFKRLSKENGGVASARNHGIRHARADYIAVIDADDLWHPQFVEKTLEALVRGGEQFSFAYALNRRIDEYDRVIGSAPRYDCEGSVLCQHAYVNFVGNGSAMLMRRNCVLECGGYDETLHARGSQGCEDWLMQMRLAESHQVAQVPEYLVGYRQISGQMSENCDAMSSSLELVLETMKQRCPGLESVYILSWLFVFLNSTNLFQNIVR
jgi:glycosyltransferase involved in cell wall biosynthesis